MRPLQSIDEAWAALPAGARSALDAQWRSVAAGGLGCGSAIVGPDGAVMAAGRNCVHDVREAPGEADRPPLCTHPARACRDECAGPGAGRRRPCRPDAVEHAPALPDVRGGAGIRRASRTCAALQRILRTPLSSSTSSEGRALNGPGAHGDALWWTGLQTSSFSTTPPSAREWTRRACANARPCLPRLAEFRRPACGHRHPRPGGSRGPCRCPTRCAPIEDELAHCVAELRSTVRSPCSD
jgi:hypothetical protein